MHAPPAIQYDHDHLVDPLPVPQLSLAPHAFDHEPDLLVHPPGALTVAADLRLDAMRRPAR
ncbi:hypothetical protein [Streptomyces sp. NBC_00988]|uniref:hypothetical protein n=1 Tax=Streptomyces sp. NBC_00988 TaxID=2903704 RepID=UPI003868A491